MEFRGWQHYGTSKLQVVPYMPGSPVYRDGVLSDIYFLLKAAGRVKATFCGDDKTMDEFVSYFHQLKTMQVLCQVNEDLTLYPIGISWVNNHRGVDGARACMVGEAFFRVGKTREEKVQLGRDARDLCRLGLAYFFEELRITHLQGVQVVGNVKALNWSQKLGWKVVATIPNWHFIDGRLVDANIVALERDEYMAKFEEWFAIQEKPRKAESPIES